MYNLSCPLRLSKIGLCKMIFPQLPRHSTSLLRDSTCIIETIDVSGGLQRLFSTPLISLHHGIMLCTLAQIFASLPHSWPHGGSVLTVHDCSFWSAFWSAWVFIFTFFDCTQAHAKRSFCCVFVHFHPFSKSPTPPCQTFHGPPPCQTVTSPGQTQQLLPRHHLLGVILLSPAPLAGRPRMQRPLAL